MCSEETPLPRNLLAFKLNTSVFSDVRNRMSPFFEQAFSIEGCR
jgi:hypothetical protein